MSDRRNELWKKYGGGDKEKALAGYEQRVQQTAQVQQRDAAREISEIKRRRREEKLAAQRGLERFRADRERRNAEIQSRAGIMSQVHDNLAAGGGAALAGAVDYGRNLVEDTSWREPGDGWQGDWLEEFGYRYNRDPEDAYKYAQQINDHLKAGRLQAQQKELGKTNALLSMGLGAAAAPLGMADPIEKVLEYAARGTITQRDHVTPATFSRDLTGAVGQRLNEEHGTIREGVPILGGKGWGDLYGIANSAVQSMALGNALGSAGTLATYFGQSAGGGMEEIKARGGTDEQAILYGLASGAFEALAEKLPLDNLLKGGDAVHFTLKSFLGNALKQAGMEGTEEAVTSFANEMADRLIMGDKSNFNMTVRELVAQGMDEDEAKKEAWKRYASDMAFDFLGGALSGAGSMAVQTGPSTIMANHQTRKAYTPEMDAALLEIAGQTEEGSRPYNLAQEYAKAGKLSGGQLNQLAGVYEEYTDAQEAEELTEAAREKLEAMDAEDDTVARAIAKKLTGQELNRRERRALERSAEGKKVLQDMQAEQELPATPETPDAGYPWKHGNPMLRNYEQNLRSPVAADPLMEAIEAQEIAEAAMAAEEGAENAHSNPVGEADGIAEGAVAENATVEPSGISEQLTGEAPEAAQAVEASVENVEETASIPDDSGAEVEPEVQGRTIEEVVGEYGNQAKAVSDLYQEGQDVEKFASAVRAAWEMGGSGIPMERVNSSPRTQGITQEQRRTAYLLGQGAARVAAQSQTAANAKKATGGTVRRKGVVKAQSGITISELSQTFNDRQRSAYKLLSFYAEVTGIDVVLYKGTQEQETGRFAHGEDTIYIDITAGTNGWDTTDLSAYTMMRTFSHEFVHFVEKWSAEQYNQLREVVFSQMEKNGQDAEALVELAMQEQGLDFDQASREVVAEALTDILPDSQFVQTLASKHKSLFEKIKERLEAFVSELKDHWKKLTGNNSREAVALKSQVGEALGYAEEVLQAFSKVAGEAVEAYQGTVSEKEVVREEPKPKKAEKPKAETEQAAKPEKPAEAPKQEERAARNEKPAEVAVEEIRAAEAEIERAEAEVDAAEEALEKAEKEMARNVGAKPGAEAKKRILAAVKKAEARAADALGTARRVAMRLRGESDRIRRRLLDLVRRVKEMLGKARATMLRTHEQSRTVARATDHRAGHSSADFEKHSETIERLKKNIAQLEQGYYAEFDRIEQQWQDGVARADQQWRDTRDRIEREAMDEIRAKYEHDVAEANRQHREALARIERSAIRAQAVEQEVELIPTAAKITPEIREVTERVHEELDALMERARSNTRGTGYEDRRRAEMADADNIIETCLNGIAAAEAAGDTAGKAALEHSMDLAAKNYALSKALIDATPELSNDDIRRQERFFDELKYGEKGAANADVRDALSMAGGRKYAGYSKDGLFFEIERAGSTYVGKVGPWDQQATPFVRDEGEDVRTAQSDTAEKVIDQLIGWAREMGMTDKYSEDKPAAAPKQEAQTITDDRFTIETTKGGTVFVTFPGKPDVAVRDALKAQGFKWSPKKKAWYAKGDPAAIADFLREVYKAEETLKTEEPVEAAHKAEEAAPVAEASETTIKEETEHDDEAEAGGILADRAHGPGDSGVLGAGEAGAGAGNDGGGDPVGVPGERGREAVRHGSGADARRSERGSDNGGSQGRVSGLTDEAPAPELSEAAQEQVERSAPREPESGNWVIGDSLDLHQGDKARIRANLDAIAIVKRLEATGQRATAAEQAQLAKYVGWGGLDSIFNDYHKAHATEREELKKLLTDQEYRAARASTTTAFYTDIGIIRAVYDGLTSLGFTGGRILEPAAGVGHFAGAMPAHVRQGIKSMTMVELDSITGAIAKHLYPGMDVRVEGFETTNLPNNYMDAAVGNVPFGNFGVVDKSYPKKIAGTIHNYFFAKTLDKVRPGGIVVMLTSRYTMDSNDSTAREYISKKADLLGAIRLPDSAFKDNAGTEVVSDILIFKKRAAGTPYGGADFVAGPQYYNGTNDYFKQHPEMILGTIEQKSGRYGLGTTIKAREGDLGQQIREAFAKIEGKMDYPAAKDREHTNFAVERGARKPKSGGYAIQDGKLVRSENGQMVDHKLDEKTAKRVEGMVGIRDAARKLQNAQLQGQNPASIGKARKELNSLYDAFVKQHGFLNAPANKKAMQDDPDRYSILALENWDTDTKKATKADIFSKNTVAPNRTVTSAETVEEGLIVSRNQTGGVDTALIARLTGRSEEEVTRELIDTRLAFKRADGTLEAAETYLSGNVRAKLREADGLVGVDADFRNNIEALRPIIPKDIPHTEIFVNPGATWIPAQLYGDFAAELLGGSNSEWRQDVKVTYHPQTGSYAVTLNSAYLKSNARNTQKYGTPRKTFLEILEAVLNSKSITVWDKVDDIRVVNEQATAAANEKAEQLGEELRKWLWKDEGRRAELARLYNEQFNCLVNPKYDGSKLTFNGMNAAMKLRPHQLDAVARIISSGGNTLLAHRVGAGKTFEMAAAAMKLKELGLVKKPMFAVPKSLVAQWGKEFADLFPAARLMVAEPGDFTADNRKTFANRIANGEYDAVIVSYEQFERLPISADFATRLYQEQVDSIVDAIAEAKAEEGKRASVKDLERTRKSLENKIKTLADSAKDDDIRFEELGVDALFVDEAHNFKNLFYTTSMSNVSGLGNRDGSKRAFDLYTKVRYLQQLNGGKGIVFATATPVMNSMAEMFIMQRYLQPQMLHDLGIENFDAWAKQFGEVVNGLEVNPSGTGYRIKQSFSRFKNLPELQLMFRNMADVMTTVPGLKIPKMKGGKPIIVECEPGEFQKAYMKQLAKRVEQVKGKDPREDNMLKITSDGRKIAYTQRMIDPTLPYEEGCKLFRCADNVLETYRKTGEDRGVQMVFLDMATPKGKSGKEEATADDGMDMENARLYEDLRKRLTDGGIPAKEIAFIHDADTDAKKKKLFQDVNEGKVRVLIGSTGKMGVGMNAQQRAVAIHHLDAPWRPGDVEQRNGRVYRQGNRNKEVACYYYVTKGSYDARLWNKLDTKQQFVEQAMSGSDVGRDIEDTGEVVLSAAEAMAVATGSPLIIEQVKLENEIKKLESLQRAHSQAVADAMGGLARNQTEAKQLEGYIEKAGQDIKRRTNAWQEKTFSVTIGKKVYTDRKEAGPAMMAAAEKAAVGTGYTTIGSFAGFDLRVVKTAEGIQAMLSGAQGYTFKTYPNNLPYMIKAMCDTAGGIDTSKRLWENRLERTREDIAEQKKLLDKPFDKEQRLRDARKRYREVMAELTPKEEQRMDRLEADGDQKQVRRVALTDRQVLELFADEALPKDASAAERDALAIHRKRLERLRTLEQDRAEAGKQYKEHQFSPNGDRAKAQEAAKRMAELDKAILKAADEVLSVEEAPVMRRVIQSARDASRRQQAKHDQDLLREYRAKRKESDGQRKYRRAIQREVKTLREWLVHPDNKNALKHIPDVLKGPVGSFIAAIDLTSTNGGTQADERMAKKMQAVLDAYKRHIDDVGGLYSGYTDLPPDFVDRLTEMVNKTWQIAKSGSGTYKIKGGEMSAADLRALYQLIKEMKRHITTVNRFHANAMFQFASDAAQDTMKHLSWHNKYRNTALDGADQFLFWKNVRPAYIWERFGKGGMAIYDGLRRGQGQLARNTEVIKKFADKAYTAQEVSAWEKEIRTVRLPGEGGKVRLTVAQIMSLYCLSKREQAVPHLLGGGIRGANIEGTDTEARHLTPEDLQAIIGRLSKRQRAVADKLQKFMSEQGGEWGNAVTVKRFGERQFTEEHYFPISTDGQLRNAEADKPDGSDLYALLNMSFTKKLTPNANNRVMLYSCFDVFANHMASMAQYNAMALPVLDALKWFNYRDTWKTVDGKPSQDSVREQMVRAFGAPVNKEGVKDGKGYAETFVLNILRSYNGTEAQGTPNDGMGMKQLHRYNRAQVAYNMSVVAKQPLAILRAAQEIPYTAIIKGLAVSPAQRKQDIAEMLKHSGIAAWKNLGFYDVNISRGLTKLIKHNDTALDKYTEIGMKGAEWADQQTWAAIWHACKEQSGGNMEKTAKLFEDVIYKTQVVDSILTKTEYMRDKGFFSRLTSSFMSEPVTAVSPMLEVVYRIKADMNRKGATFQGAWQKHGGKFGRYVYVYGVTAVMTGILQSLIDAWRDDDDYQTFAEKFLEVLGGNIVQEVNPFEKLPVVKEIGTIFSAVVAKARGEDAWLQLSTLPMADVAEYTVDATEILVKKLKGQSTGYTWYGSIRKFLQAASGGFGIPLATPTREVVDIWNNIMGRMAPSLKVKTYERKPADELRDAFLGGYVDEEEATVKLLELGKAEDENEAYWKLRGWENGSDWNKYDALEQAMAEGGDISEEMDELTTHGVKEKTVRSQIRTIVGDWLAAGAISEAEARSLLMKYGERGGEEAAEAVMKWQCEIDTGIPFNGIKEAYLDGEITADRAKQMYEKYGGYDPDKAEEAVERWRAEKETGTAYDDIAEAVLDGELSENQAARMYEDYGGYEAAEAQEMAHRLAFIRDNPGCPDISSAAVADYEDYCKGAGIGAKTFYDAWKGYNNTYSIKDESGKTVTSKREQVMAQIDAMNLTAKQKDALYFAFGYAESKLWDTPWH